MTVQDETAKSLFEAIGASFLTGYAYAGEAAKVADAERAGSHYGNVAQAR